ncbi:hypothetical protein B0H16DRAFT_1468434 [Mycena metata]|uniref:Uncharacterized protein n=1 Tax=Mycena metata TaxID=1033252 RepID=A0AAD7MTR4_9AGAR|nr:hypothetical protein B0H16DRAFT_1468434 [Mycena metata]
MKFETHTDMLRSAGVGGPQVSSEEFPYAELDRCSAIRDSEVGLWSTRDEEVLAMLRPQASGFTVGKGQTGVAQSPGSEYAYNKAETNRRSSDLHHRLCVIILTPTDNSVTPLSFAAYAERRKMDFRDSLLLWSNLPTPVHARAGEAVNEWKDLTGYVKKQDETRRLNRSSDSGAGRTDCNKRGEETLRGSLGAFTVAIVHKRDKRSWELPRSRPWLADARVLPSPNWTRRRRE